MQWGCNKLQKNEFAEAKEFKDLYHLLSKPMDRKCL